MAHVHPMNFTNTTLATPLLTTMLLSSVLTTVSPPIAPDHRDHGSHHMDHGGHHMDHGGHHTDHGGHHMDHGGHHMDHGGHHMDNESHNMDHGSHNMDHGSHNMDQGSQHMDHGGHHMDHGGHHMDNESHHMENESQHMDHGGHHMDNESHDMDHGSHHGNTGHAGMDHSGHGMSGGMHEMAMYFHTGTCETILFKEWKVHTDGEMVGAVIGVILLSLLYEGLKFLREQLYRHQYTKLSYATCAVTSVSGPGPAELHKITQNRILSWPHLLQTSLHVVQILLSYFLMLIFMTFNVWLCLAVLIGSGIGYFLFGWRKSTVVDISDHCH